jgi:hypothetical protein
MERTIWTELVRNAEILQKVKGDRNVVRTQNEKRNVTIGQMLQGDCLTKRILKGRKREKYVKGRQ